MCKHQCCTHFRTIKACKSAGSLLLLPSKVYYFDDNKTLQWKKEFVAWFGLERWGDHAGTYNVLGGKGDLEKDLVDGEYCWVETLKRELKEELKLDLDEKHYFYKIFYAPLGNKLRYSMIHSTPVFIGVLPTATQRKPFNQAIFNDFFDKERSDCHKEIINIDAFKMDGTPLDSPDAIISTYAKLTLEIVQEEYSLMFNKLIWYYNCSF